ncbi:unnamed protein product [Amoebophrya sp. A120]|nr:unnamed protein product [Amoebophrya sp. A120]|eukprot:GSA120T00001990001.1
MILLMSSLARRPGRIVKMGIVFYKEVQVHGRTWNPPKKVVCLGRIRKVVETNGKRMMESRSMTRSSVWEKLCGRLWLVSPRAVCIRIIINIKQFQHQTDRKRKGK